MKIFTAGISTETNTFCPIPTGQEDFIVQRGLHAGDMPVAYPGLDLRNLWGDMAASRGDELIFSLMAWAQPAGVTVKSAYESLREEILDDLKSVLPVDIVLLRLHGAMVAQGYDDCEEDLLRRTREIVGPQTVIAAELDLHCHLSESMIAPADIVITFKEYPHVDVNDRAEELFNLAVKARLGRIRPVSALFDCRMIGSYPTTQEPMRGFIKAIGQAEQRDGVLSISFVHGFRSADVPHAGAKMLVITDDDLDLAKQVAKEFGLRVYRLRNEVGLGSPSLPMHEALSKALASKLHPVVVADQSDNPGGGAPGDATFALRWLLDHGAEHVAMAMFYDPEAVKIAKKAGVGGVVPIRLGGKLGPASGNPVDLEVTVISFRENYVHSYPQQSGKPALFPLGDVAALRCGTIDIVVASRRCQCYAPSIFSDLGIDPARKQVLIPKSAQHFYSTFAPIAAEVIYMAAPGALPPDPRQR